MPPFARELEQQLDRRLHLGHLRLGRPAAAHRHHDDVPVEVRPRPAAPVLGRRVAFFTTAPADAHAALERHLRDELGAEVVLVCGNLARREALREDLARAGEAEVYLVEIKAAAIDVVAEAAVARGRELVFADNELIGERVDEALPALAPKRVAA